MIDAAMGGRILHIAEQKLHEAISHCDTPTKWALKPSIRKAMDTIEEVCPAAMQMTPRGLFTAYGPREDLAARDRLLLVATARDAVIIGLDGAPPEYDQPYHQVSGPVFWAAVHHLIRKPNPDIIAAAFFHRMGDRLAEADRQMAPAKAMGALPMIVALAGRGKKPRGYCGCVAIVALPPPIHIQMAAQEALGETKQ